MNRDLQIALIEAIEDANLEAYAANGREPYVHAEYEVHENRRKRLVEALADGDDKLYDRYYDALFDITLDGITHYIRAFDSIVKELASERAYEAAVAMNGWFNIEAQHIPVWF